MNEEEIFALSPAANIQKPISKARTLFDVIAKKLLSQMMGFYLQSRVIISHFLTPHPL
jgi:hypothetical protein